MDECARQRKKLAAEFTAQRRVFIALGDETRQQIFLALLANEQAAMRVPEITQKTHLSRPAVSHHLRVLREAGLISMHREGTRNYYYVDANKNCWPELKALVTHVDEVVCAAGRSGYPHFKEE